MSEFALKQSPDGQSWTIETPKPEVVKPSADLHAGMFGGIASTQVFGMPIGSAAGGLLTAGLWDAASGLLAGKLPAIPGFVMPAVGAVVTKRFLSRYVGEGVANAGALILTADALQHIFNLRGLLAGLVGGTTAKLSAPYNVVTQAERVANNYNSAFARRVG